MQQSIFSQLFLSLLTFGLAFVVHPAIFFVSGLFFAVACIRIVFLLMSS